MPPDFENFEETLKRLVDRIGKILQAEKSVCFLHDPVAGTLYATFPALGFTREQIDLLERRVSDEGITSEVFRSNVPLILYDAAHDPRAVAEDLTRFGIYNAVSVPLVVEKRDEDNRVLDRTTVGVLHVFNKVGGSNFLEEDVRLLQRMAMTAAAVIASAQTYREVAQENQELIHTIDSLYAGLLMVGANGRLVQINPSARVILGLNSNLPLIGVPFKRAIPNPKVRALLEKALATDGSEVADEITVSIEEANGDNNAKERVYQVQCAPVRSDAGSPGGVVAIFNDITDIRGVDRMKTAFISTVSHELRTPLTSIKGFIATLLADKDGYYDEATRQEFYGIIDTECDRLTRLIKDLLDISRIEQGRAMQMYWDQIDLPTLAAKVIVAQQVYAKNHTISMDFSDNFPSIEADPDKMDQILTNLVSNAIKYSPYGGPVSVIGRANGGQVTIQVRDEGIGIAREHLPKLFERFFRVDNRDNREIGGTGIGLALVKALTEAHGGTASVESDLGKGTTFTVVLPIHRVDV